MKQTQCNNFAVQFNTSAISSFFKQLIYPLAIIDFETFRNQNSSQKHGVYLSDFEKTFSYAIGVINSFEDLTLDNIAKIKEISNKVLIPDRDIFNDIKALKKHESSLYEAMIEHLLDKNIQSIVFMGARTETVLLKNYLTYFDIPNHLRQALSFFFINNRIFDIYQLWNNDHMILLPHLKKSNFQEIGATKKTVSLVTSNQDFIPLLLTYAGITNNDLGRIMDKYFQKTLCLLPLFTTQVSIHNSNDILIGMAILILLKQWII